MAKPKPGRWNKSTRSATPDTPSSSSCRANHVPYLHHNFPHRPSARAPSPSQAVLSALAIIASTTPAVAGSPLPTQVAPPSFLCPFIERDNIDPLSIVSTSSYTTIPITSTPTSTIASYSPISERIADKYVKGTDDLWRKTDMWTLFGSTCCSSPTITPITQSVPTTSFSTSLSTMTPDPQEFDTSSLPAGWLHTPPTSSTESTIILALAIVLAGSICVFIIGCVIWRKRKKKLKDMECKASRPDNASEDEEWEKDARGKMRIWTKASIRWKTNIRHAARRRRKKPVSSRAANRLQTPIPNDPPELLAAVSSAISPHGSFMSQEAGDFSPDLSSSNSNTTALPDTPFSPSPPRPSPSPPTYGSPVVPVPSSGKPPSVACHSNPTLSCANSDDCTHSCVQDEEPLPYLPPSDGHVATDDKVQLARIHELASSPNVTNDPGTSTVVSVPAWHEVEDDLDNLGIGLTGFPIPTPTPSHPPLFPPPPVEVNVPLRYLEPDPFHFGQEINVSGPLSEPSAPSLEVSPSAPPVDSLDLAPSAPSLDDEDGLYEDWDGASAYSPAASLTGSTSSSLPSSSTRCSAPTDSVLPQYQP